jgi:DNA-binding GntR family transcriptional regulator
MTVTIPALKPIAEQVLDRLRQELLAGTHLPGTPLREDELAERFGVSRHPIRKVLQQLTLEGLLVAKPNCGVTVAPDQSAHVGELLTPMRCQLELYALRLVTSEQLAARRGEWARLIQQMARAAEDRDEQGVLSLDAEFHQLLLKAAGMEGFIPLWLAIFGRMRGHHRASNHQLNDLGVVAYVHERLLESLLSDDRERTAADWRSHLENGAFNQRAKASWQRRQKREDAR